MKNKIKKIISELEKQFPEIKNISNYEIEIKTNEELNGCPTIVDALENKLFINDKILNDIPKLNYCIVFNAKIEFYKDIIRSIECETKRSLMIIAANFKVNSELNYFENENFKAPKDVCYNKKYDNMSFEDILSDVTIYYSGLGELV